MAFLRAYIDDSAADIGDRRLFYAGYLHRADVWAAFSEFWETELRSWPSIRYFKAKEAQNLGEEFSFRNGWTEELRDAKLAMLAEIISAFQPYSFEFSVSRKVVEEELKPVAARGLSNPHFCVAFAVVAGLANFCAESEIDEPIEFIFDEQDGVDADISLFFNELKEHLPEKSKRLISGAPCFKNDKDKRFRPLQAADMLAWHIRREHEFSERLPLTNKLLHPDGHIVQEMPDALIRRWAEHDKKFPELMQLQSKVNGRFLKKEIKKLKDAGINPSKLGTSQ